MDDGGKQWLKSLGMCRWAGEASTQMKQAVTPMCQSHH